ncbi:hypothetical protein BGZ96_006165 [Linnemannia gamsii]|uniref:ER membrane protein complex subunit 7 beta-sandwich domain-containing protein n=1 Tax=Linnemannia gamsii TaxID=64522 RepID=A0ABQ7K3F0_9FUNG|nr:hypothetical protein BGZ96_006165 [Linnemannia gamsii]
MKAAYSSILIALTGLASLAASVDAAVVEGRLLAATFRGRVTRGVSMKTKVLLGGGRYQTQIAKDGTFEFPDVPVGTYILEVQSPHLVYSRVRVVVTQSEVVAMRVSIGDHFSNVLHVLPMPLTLRPRPRPIHYIPPEGQKVVGFFGNPMVLMASFSFMMLLIMPKIMSNLAYNGNNHVGFATTSSTTGDANSSVGIHHGVNQTYPATLGDPWAQQQQQPLQAGGTPVQTKKQK